MFENSRNTKESIQKEDFVLMIVSMFVQEASVADLWRLDTLGITNPVQKRTKNTLQAEVKEHFRQTIRIDDENRYEDRVTTVEG